MSRGIGQIAGPIMASIFPGMDPYLEDPAFWPDFHHTFIDDWRDAVADGLPEHYEARLNESVNLVRLSPEAIKLVYPDVAVSRKRRRVPTRSSRSSVLTLEPVTIPHVVLGEMRQGRIEILHRPRRTLVAILELLSPWNKTGDGHLEYLAKRKAILAQRVHLVELDLLVGGQRPPLAQPLPAGDYHAFVSRADNRSNCEVYSWTVRQRLPQIPIPLLAPDADVLIDLGAVFQVTYRRGRYASSLPYRQSPTAPLRSSDLQWARTRARGGPKGH
jgi:hypothetical protein